MKTQLALVLTTVNAPYGTQLDGATLALCLSDMNLAKKFPGHVSNFLSEVSPTLQSEFAAAHKISIDDLKAFASQFSAWSGETYKFAA